LAAWWSVRSRGGTFVWRLEDLDPPRALAGAAEAALEDLAWLGIDWDEGGGRGGSFGPYVQSQRSEHYRAALFQLDQRGWLFPCRRSRKDLRELATAPHGPHQGPAYPARLRPTRLERGWLTKVLEGNTAAGAQVSGKAGAAVRFRVHDEPVTFADRVLGSQTERVDRTVGDFVLRRRDGLWAYQLAVVVDDLLMEIDDLVRGSDLLDSTARQIQLIEALGGTPPAYAHVPLVLNAEGEKLSKRDEGLTLRSVREAGVEPRKLVGYLAWSLGLQEEPRPRSAGELVEGFDWRRVRTTDHVLPEDLARRLTSR
jgi:glutamyl-tRNA synthetase